MDWYFIELAVINMGFAVLIARLVFGNKPEKKTAYTIAVVIIFCGFNIASKQFILPEIHSHKANANIESAINTIPAFASIKKYEPIIYQQIIDALIDATKKGNKQQQAVEIAKTKISSFVESRIPHASDEAITGFMDVMVAQMTELQIKGGGICHKLLFPQVGSVVDRKIFSQEIQDQSLSDLDEVIKTSNIKRVTPPESEVMTYLEPALVNLYSKFGDDVDMLENPTASTVDKEKVCSITKELYIEILKLPPENATSALRWVFG